MTEQDGRPRLHRVERRRDRELPREKPTRARGVDYEIGSEVQRDAVAPASEAYTARVERRGRQLDAIAIVDTGSDRSANKVMIDVRAKPVAV
jgi:hypothetical protein